MQPGMHDDNIKTAVLVGEIFGVLKGIRHFVVEICDDDILEADLRRDRLIERAATDNQHTIGGRYSSSIQETAQHIEVEASHYIAHSSQAFVAND